MSEEEDADNQVNSTEVPPAPETGALSAPKRNISKRFCAYLIDLILISVINLVLFSWLSMMIFGAFQVLPALFESVYILLKDGLFKGQSVGKKLTGLRVVNLDGEKCSIKRSIIRNIPLAVAFLPIYKLLFIAESIALVIPKDGRRLGDRFAKTRVIDERPDVPARVFICISIVLSSPYLLQEPSFACPDFNKGPHR